MYKVHFASVLGPVPIKEINYSLISDFVDTMMDDAKSIATIKRNIVLLSKTLKHSHRMGWIEAMPPIPAISSKSTVRSWLSPSEYHQLLRYLVARVETGLEPMRRSGVRFISPAPTPFKEAFSPESPCGRLNPA